MTKLDILNLWNNLQKLGGLSGVKFAYAVSKNLSILKPEIEALEKAQERSEEFKKFDDLRIALAEKHAKKDKDNKPVIVGNDYQIEDRPAFDKELEKLKQEYKNVVDAREKQMAEVTELLKTESSVKLYKMFLADVPESITVEQMFSIKDIVEDTTPSPYNDK